MREDQWTIRIWQRQTMILIVHWSCQDRLWSWSFIGPVEGLSHFLTNLLRNLASCQTSFISEFILYATKNTVWNKMIFIYSLHYLCITLVKIRYAALQKKEGLTSKYISKFQKWFIAKGWYECKVEIEIKKELTKASHS
jgi:hypothetical protein